MFNDNKIVTKSKNSLMFSTEIIDFFMRKKLMILLKLGV